MKHQLYTFLFLWLLINVTVEAQILAPVKWNSKLEKIDATTYTLKFTAKIEKDWHMYGLNIPEGGPVATSFNYNLTDSFNLVGPPKSSINPEKKFDKTFEMDLELFAGTVTFTQNIKLKNSKAIVSGYIQSMSCDDSRCLPPSETEFSFVLGEESSQSIIKASQNEKNEPGSLVKKPKIIEKENNDTIIANITVKQKSLPESKNDTEKGLLSLFLIALLAGFGALLTPCVYPIIPLTVSYFLRDNTSRGKNLFQALTYGFSIVLIYTLVGVIAGLFKIDLVRLVSSHWIPNLIFFLIFIALAFSFFGMFEIMLPSSFSNKIDQQADKGGIMGPFFMALATVVVSFSCTGPIVGVVLGGAMQGDLIKPIIGMFGFSLSFALPFTLLAIFPGVMKNLPKSGGWLNAVKVFFAFILLAFSLIFLSNLGLKIITRDIILAIAIVIFILLGFYLLGKIRFSHDSELKYVSVPRIILAIISFSISVYLVPGLFGSPLKAISAFLPPQETSELSSFSNDQQPQISNNKQVICDAIPRYSDFLHLPLGLEGYFDYNEGINCAKQQNKPVLLYFVGHYCKNCKDMYAEVWSNPQVLNKLRDEFLIVALYTDDRTNLPENEWITSSIDGKVKKTLGKKNLDFEVQKFGSNALPLYAIINTEGNVLTSKSYYTYSSNVDDFLQFLNEGISNYKH